MNGLQSYHAPQVQGLPGLPQLSDFAWIAKCISCPQMRFMKLVYHALDKRNHTPTYTHMIKQIKSLRWLFMEVCWQQPLLQTCNWWWRVFYSYAFESREALEAQSHVLYVVGTWWLYNGFAQSWVRLYLVNFCLLPTKTHLHLVHSGAFERTSQSRFTSSGLIHTNSQEYIVTFLPGFSLLVHPSINIQTLQLFFNANLKEFINYTSFQ